MKLFKRKFPFSDAPNTMCFTCCHVLNENKPILYVSHDKDDCWQFLCGRNHTEDEARIVSLAEMLEIDKSVAKLADLSEENARKNVTALGFYGRRLNNSLIYHRI